MESRNTAGLEDDSPFQVFLRGLFVRFHACFCVCIYICMYTCMYLYIYINTVYLCMYLYLLGQWLTF